MSGRARPHAVFLGLLLAVGPVASARAASETRSAPTQSGWWNRLQGPAEGEPDGNRVRPFVPAVPKPPNVPADAIATSGGAGQVDKVAAVGIDLALADGAAVGGLTLRLKESPANGANVGADKAKVTACPATAPWGPGQNAAWRERPTADCSPGSADGVRAADGTWTFDLTAIGRLWADPAKPLAGNGVVLAVDSAGSPSPVQVSWLDVDSGHVAVELTATPAAPAPAPSAGAGPSAPEAAAAASPVPAVAAPSVDSAAAARAFPAGSGGISADPFAYPSGQPTFAAIEPAGTATAGSGAPPAPPAEHEAALTVPPAPPGPVLRARPAVDFWEHVPTPTALLLPAAVGLAVLIGVVLGPTGRPSPVFRREGGLSRALARRNSIGGDAGLRPPSATGLGPPAGTGLRPPATR